MAAPHSSSAESTVAPPSTTIAGGSSDTLASFFDGVQTQLSGLSTGLAELSVEHQLQTLLDVFRSRRGMSLPSPASLVSDEPSAAPVSPQPRQSQLQFGAFNSSPASSPLLHQFQRLDGAVLVEPVVGLYPQTGARASSSPALQRPPLNSVPAPLPRSPYDHSAGPIMAWSQPTRPAGDQHSHANVPHGPPPGFPSSVPAIHNYSIHNNGHPIDFAAHYLNNPSLENQRVVVINGMSVCNEKLGSTNFQFWFNTWRSHLIGYNLWIFVTVVPTAANMHDIMWVRQDQLLRVAILSTLTIEVFNTVLDKQTSYEV